MVNLCKYPRISCAPLAIISPSQPVSCCIRYASCGVKISPFPMTGIFYCFFHFPDNLPVRFAGVILFPGPSMHRNGSCPGLFRNMCHFYRIDMGIVKALSDFLPSEASLWLLLFFDDFTCQNRIFHQCRAVTIIDYLWHRTSHIDVKNIKRSMLDTLCHLAHNFRVGAKSCRETGCSRSSMASRLSVFLLL